MENDQLRHEPVRCGECLFWDGSVDIYKDGIADNGICRCHAPLVHLENKQGAKEPWAVWPETASTDWCGEGERK